MVDKSVKIVTDGSAIYNPGPMAIGVLLLNEGERTFSKTHRKIGRGTNNVAEAKALIEGLQQATEKGYTCVEAYTDSELLYKHHIGAYRVKNGALRELHKQIKYLTKNFTNFKLHWHRRDAPLAQIADDLSKNNMNIEEQIANLYAT